MMCLACLSPRECPSGLQIWNENQVEHNPGFLRKDQPELETQRGAKVQEITPEQALKPAHLWGHLHLISAVLQWQTKSELPEYPRAVAVD